MEYEGLIAAPQILPGNTATHVPLFTGIFFVFNVNVLNYEHHNQGDLDICAMISIGDFEGGELVIVEPGLVVCAHQGDLILF